MDVLDQAAPGQGDLAPVLVRQRHDLLQAGEHRREGGDDHALSLRLAQQPVQRFADDALGFRAPGAVRIGAVADHCQHAVRRKGAQAVQVGRAPAGGRLVQLVVAGVDDRAHRRIDHEPDGIGDGMRHGERRDVERPEVDRFVLAQGAQVGAVQHVLLFELALDEPQRERRAVNGRVDLAQQVGQGRDVIHVAVRQDDAAQAVLVLDDVFEIGQHQVDAVHIVIGEFDPAVDDNHVAAIFVDGHVLADFPQAAQGSDL